MKRLTIIIRKILGPKEIVDYLEIPLLVGISIEKIDDQEVLTLQEDFNDLMKAYICNIQYDYSSLKDAIYSFPEYFTTKHHLVFISYENRDYFLGAGQMSSQVFEPQEFIEHLVTRFVTEKLA